LNCRLNAGNSILRKGSSLVCGIFGSRVRESSAARNEKKGLTMEKRSKFQVPLGTDLHEFIWYISTNTYIHNLR
jgi:hypothetical protein